MKKQLLFFLSSFLFFSVIASAQIKKNATFLGGNISASVEKSKSLGNQDYKEHSYFVSPVFGKAIRENLVLGADVNIGFSKNSDFNTTPSKQKNYGAGVFLRQYKPLGKSSFLLFLQERLGYNYISTGTYSNTIYDYSNKRNSIAVNAYPGISYAVNRRLQLETGLNNLLSMEYFSERTELNYPAHEIRKANGFSIASSLGSAGSLYVGFRLLIN